MAKRVYGAQVLLADPTRTLEAAVWEEGLKSMLLCLKDASGDLDEEGQLRKVLPGLLTEKLCLCVGFGINKAGSGMYYDLFDISPQVTEEGAAGAFKALDADVFFASPGIVSACCHHCQSPRSFWPQARSRLNLRPLVEEMPLHLGEESQGRAQKQRNSDFHSGLVSNWTIQSIKTCVEHCPKQLGSNFLELSNVGYAHLPPLQRSTLGV